MPISISELIGKELTDEEIEDLAVRCTFYGSRKVGAFVSLDHDELKKIYTMAK
ncbi:hypothetical protein SDC9_174445 [bioreactor metagenome]|uniref:Alcohol dehydrogenase iron-type/glycerol dehydrogenase GldA domain-containing protein n=1 Tax=bioreactor metagenome TaxID=1076179 RepID=A0A645GJA9_9ZZZZ